MLKTLSTYIDTKIRTKSVAGACVLIQKNNIPLYQYCKGKSDYMRTLNMSVDTIFSIASCTKPITSTGLMLLYDEGKFDLDDPVEKYIPEFHNIHKSNTSNTCEKPFTIKQLLSHTAGFTYNQQMGLTKGPIPTAYDDAGIFIQDLDTVMKQIAKIPLLYEPGSQWQYSISTDIVGYLIERLSGQKLDEFLHTRLFVPLSMNNTYFHVPENKKQYIADILNPSNKRFVKIPHFKQTDFLSGGSGLYSTPKDYLQFCQMIST